VLVFILGGVQVAIEETLEAHFAPSWLILRSMGWPLAYWRPPRPLLPDIVVTTMEALLIEGLEPPQNRRRGDDFRAVEYLQAEDPEMGKRRMVSLLAEISDKLNLK
jgi:hypothetical protein